ncbi:hypothetical protein DL766_002781 [Monosporascus sp. MC13-8B]|uniref:S-adenosyl-L-methionine-dependent N-methyltransferase n=1 Tax=Monosporascus cannonballus TaxID=155416 RepID=A0ABY0HL09_9PEZI|nr:hypothetical protein DL762_000529 [Monosporascus cannonballus]RYO96040.1 hypothetical protein DL763_003432 [Monosporascus cannonballus]RYP34883.1 hypothetical protein DL766_002781 [Monosporascus sp. MC13-8B]
MTSRWGRRQARVYLVGDSTLDVATGLLTLLRNGHSPLLQSFFEATYRVIRAEVATLAAVQRASFPHFSSIQDLLALQRRGHLHPALHKALVCAFQLAAFICGSGEPHDLFTQQDDLYLVGLCTGALAAAAISSSRHISDLLKLGPHAVGVAFRTAFRAYEVAESIEHGFKSWSITVTNSSENELRKLISDFSDEKRLPVTSRPYLSFIAATCITVSGPPSVLRCLRESNLAGNRMVDLNLYVPYHAKHLFTLEDVDSILSTSPVSEWSRYISQLPVISPADGTIKHAQHYHGLLHGAVEDILMNPISWEDVVNGLAYVSRFSSPGILSMCAVGTTLDRQLRNTLEQRGFAVDTSTLLSEPSTHAPEVSARELSSEAYASTSGKSKIAIVGMSGRFPGAEDLGAFWDLLFKGLDVHKVVPPSRWNAGTHVDRDKARKNTSSTPFGCWLDNPGVFDAKFFNVTPREAPQIDPASRLALMTAYEAMESAGMVPGTTPSTQKDRVGVVYGVTSNDWMEVNSAQNIDAFFIPGGCRAFIPGRINYFFKFSGPSLSLDTACSSSLSAIHTACNSLWQGDVDTVIAGGTNVLTNPDYTAGLDRGHFLSRTGNCKTFDQTADGYCRAEGVCTVILKRLDDAIAENDPILAVILGAHTNHSAETDSITRPLAEAQKRLFDKILSDASVDPLEIGYVEMHGTGTQTGDPIEIESVVDTFAPKGPLPRKVDRPLFIGAVKSNVGHGEAAAGVTSLAKALLMMKHDTIPPHAGIRTKVHEKFAAVLDERNVHIAREPLEWKRNNSSRKVFINNFSAAGGNSALLIEDAPELPCVEGTDPRSTHILTASAKTSASLKRNIESLAIFLSHDTSVCTSLPALSYTATARRAHYPYRVAVYGANLGQIKAELQKVLDRDGSFARPHPALHITFAFTGNGSQYCGMAKQLFENFPTFRADLIRYDRLVQCHGFPSCISLSLDATGSIDDFDPVTVQVATVCLELALARLCMSWGIKPSSVVGHSLGEYAALAVSGVLSEADAIFLVARRAQLLQQRCRQGSHSMLAVHASRSVLDRFLSGRRCDVACINGPEDVVLAGTVDELRELKALLHWQGIKATPLNVPYAFHSAQVDPILDELEEACQGVSFHKPTVPVICPLLATVVHEAGTFSPHYLRRHCRESVDFLGAVRNAHSDGVMNARSVVLELGPQPITCGMIRNTFGDTITTLAILKKGQDTFPLLTKSLSSLYTVGCNIDWREYHSGFPMSHQVVQLPAYSWDLKEYWIQYVHDWSLRKGDPVPDSLKAPVTFKESSVLETLPSVSAIAVPLLENTMIHSVLKDSLVGKTCFFVVETDLSREDINPIARGHKVNKIPLITPSVYAEIAQRIGKHIIDKYQPHLKECSIGVEEMTIERALVVHDGPQPQVLRSTVSYDMGTSTATCHFETFDPKAQKPRQHSQCKLRFRNRATALSTVQAHIKLSQVRIGELDKEVGHSSAYRFSKSMIYKIVGSLAQFDPDYRQLDEIVLNSSTMDASSKVGFGNLKSAGTFYTNPVVIDALSQSAGFIMNGNDGADLSSEVFVNHGWASFQLFEEISASRTYRTYCKMEQKQAKHWEGNCLVLDGDTIVAWFGGINLQGVPYRVLQYILSNEHSSQSASSMTVASSTSALKSSQKMKPKLQSVPTSKAAAPKHAASPLTPTVETAVPVARDSGNEKVLQVLQVLSEETGIPSVELTYESEFTELGVDSLVMLQIASRLNEKMIIDIEPSTLSSMATVKDLCQFVHPGDPVAEFPITVASEAGVSTSTEIPKDAPVEKHMVDRMAPLPVKSGVKRLPQEHASALNAPSGQEFGNSTPAYDDELVEKALQIISEETGVAVGEFTEDTVFADMGVDSMLTLMIMARYREELELDVSAGVSMFTELPTVYDLKRFLGNSSDAPAPTAAIAPPSSSSSSSETGRSTEASSWVTTPDLKGESESSLAMQGTQTHVARAASSVILQGRPRNDPQTLILFPDGSGCAASYVAMAPVRPGLAVIGLNCPYYRHPEEMEDVTLDALMRSYLNEVRRRQPTGPYNLGGWSSGGILAFRAAQMLIQEGDQVDTLVLIDAPPPTGLDPLPDRWYEHCAKANLFGNMPGLSVPSSTPLATLVPHFRAMVDMLRNYHADPLPVGFTPRTSIALAGTSVFDGRPGRPVFQTRPEDPEGIKFLTQPRTDWTAGAWAPLFPLDEPAVYVMEGQDHFSMMQKENGEQLAKFISDATAI